MVSSQYFVKWKRSCVLLLLFFLWLLLCPVVFIVLLSELFLIVVVGSSVPLPPFHSSSCVGNCKSQSWNYSENLVLFLQASKVKDHDSFDTSYNGGLTFSSTIFFCLFSKHLRGLHRSSILQTDISLSIVLNSTTGFYGVGKPCWD